DWLAPAFVAFCSASAEELAAWSVLAHWPASWACPDPPQPVPQLSLLDCVWVGSWVVSALLDADESASLLAGWAAPALVAAWPASAVESAAWSVLAHWPAAWACPEPPQPAPQLSLLLWLWSVLWVVSAVLSADDVAEFSATWASPALVASCSAFAEE